MKPNQRRSPLAQKQIRINQQLQYQREYNNQQVINTPVQPYQPTYTPIDIRNLQTAQSVDKYTLNQHVWYTPLRTDIVQRVVEWQRAKSRAGLSNTKSRGDVSGTGKKPHPQKGTGRARQGTKRGPFHVGGGVAHGPHPRSYEISLNKKIRRYGMRVVLSNMYSDNKLYVIDNMLIDSHQTKSLINILKNNNWSNQRVLLCYSQNESVDNNLFLAGRNLGNSIDFIEQIGLNVLSMIRHDILVITKHALIELEKRLDESQRLPHHTRQSIDNAQYHESLKQYKWAKNINNSKQNRNNSQITIDEVADDDKIPNAANINI